MIIRRRHRHEIACRWMDLSLPAALHVRLVLVVVFAHPRCALQVCVCGCTIPGTIHGVWPRQPSTVCNPMPWVCPCRYRPCTVPSAATSVCASLLFVVVSRVCILLEYTVICVYNCYLGIAPPPSRRCICGGCPPPRRAAADLDPDRALWLVSLSPRARRPV